MLCLVFGAFESGLWGQGDAVQAEVRARAEAAYVAGDLLGALPDYERLVSLFPEEACLHGRLAGCALKEPGRLSLVRRHLRIALRMGCSDIDLGFHQARLAQLEYDFDRARDLYAAYLTAAGKKARFKTEAERGALFCENADWNPTEAVSLEVFERIPSDPDAAFRYYDPEVEGLRLVSTPASLRSKADIKWGQGRMALHDGDTVLVFASLGKKGATGWDLYRVSIQQGAYTEPTLLQGTINSEFDEKDAYLSKEGILYYASNRPGGLGGFDIYAVTCGLDGMPTGQPYRLPYPINSVNDDVFFIPEAAGGAWMASNRASIEGKVHAYRIGLGEGEMATGSIAWSADEVEGEGFKLRVFASGEEVAAGDLNGDAVAHLAFSGDASVRIVLEDAAGQVLAESFGAGEGAWELKKSSGGWSVEDKSDVLADWAVLSDLQVGASVRNVSTAPATSVNGGTDADSDLAQGEAGRGWATWIGNRNNDAVASMSVEGVDDAAGGSDLSVLLDKGDTPHQTEAAEEVQGATTSSESDSAAAPEDAAAIGDVAPDSDSASESSAEEPTGSTSASSAAPKNSDEAITSLESWDTGDVESLMTQTPEGPEVVEEMLASKPGLVVEIWEARAAQILTLEQGFLDEPDFNKAGALYDLLDEMESWVPQGEMMTPLLQDGADIADMRDMLDEWSFAVQSASKASLAKVAGEAALAFRRERLAIRELWEASELDLTPLKGRWSDWRDANRGLPGTRPSDASLSVEDGELLLGRWNGVLMAADETWSRKERSGWRGDWLGRQQVELKLNQDFWENEMELLATTALASETDQVEPERTEVNPSESAEVSEDVLLDVEGEGGFRIPIEGDANASLVAQLLPSVDGEAESVGSEFALAPGEAAWSSDWDAAVSGSKEVSRQWERLSRASGGRGVAPVANGEGLEGLSPALRSAYSGLVQSVMDELLELRTEWNRERDPLVAQWEEKEFAGMGNSDAMVEVRELWRAAQQAEERAESLQRGRREGEAAEFDRMLAQREALSAAETAWRAWESAWNDVLEAAALLEEGEETVPVSLDPEGDLVQEEAADTEPGLEETGSEETSNGQPSDPQDAEEWATASNFADGANQDEEDLTDAAVADGMGQEVAEEPVAAAEPQTDQTPSPLAPLNETVEPLNTGPVALDLTEVLENSTDERLERVSSVMTAMDAAQKSGSPLVLEPSEQEALAAWRERLDVLGNDPGATAGRAARMAWDKRMFFNERRLRTALNALDVEQLERKLSGGFVQEEEVSVSVFEEARVSGGEVTAAVSAETDTEVPSEVATADVVMSEGSTVEVESANRSVEEEADRTQPEGGAASEAAASEAVSRQDADVAAYGLVLPEAEVWGSASNRGRNGGLTLRPIDRAALERTILAQPFSAETEDAAAARFNNALGAPAEEGVEYKIQIGAFRKALPAALFAAFDPMWAQELANGITRYMAGSFDLYDPAVAARDAIRALGYEDAFVVRFVDGERVRASRPEPALLEEERASVAGTDVLSPRPVGAALSEVSPAEDGGRSTVSGSAEAGSQPLPTRREDIPTWDGISGRVYSVQVGAFRGVPDAEAMAALGTLTREDAGSDGWLRLFSGRFVTQSEAEEHRRELRSQGRADAFIVVYINGRRIPLSQASLTSVASLPGAPNEGSVETVEQAVTDSPVEEEDASWSVQLGVFNSTIPVRLANAILDAPLQWQIRSVRSEGLTRYRTAFVAEEQAQRWLIAAQAQGFTNAQLVQE